MEDDPFGDQENIFKDDVNDNVQSVYGTIKSENQPKQVSMNSQDSYNKLKDDPVAMLRAVSASNVDDYIKNAQEPNQSDELQKRKVLNNYDSTFEYHCKHGKFTKKVIRKLYIVFRIGENFKYCFIKLEYSNLFAKIYFKIISKVQKEISTSCFCASIDIDTPVILFILFIIKLYPPSTCFFETRT